MIEEVVLYTDGSINQGTMGYGFLAVCPFSENVVYFCGSRACGNGTSNIAEYRGLIAGLYACWSHGVRRVRVKSDSQLAVKQIMGEYRTTNKALQEHRDLVLALLTNFEDFSVEWIPRSQNKRADALAGGVFRESRERCSKEARKQHWQSRSR